MIYRPNFKDRLPTVLAAIDGMPGSLDTLLPGMTKAKLKRFFQRFDVLLGRLDKQGAKQPQYLMYGGQLLPDYLATIWDQSIAHMPSGSATFVQSNMPQLVDMQDKLERAVGTDVDELKRISSTTAADLGVYVQQANDLLNQLTEAQTKSAGHMEIAERDRKLIADLLNEVEKQAASVREARQNVDRLTSPNGKSQTSLEALARRARERIAEIDDIGKRALDASSKATQDRDSTAASLNEANTLLISVREIEQESQKVLNLSSQAGLAASYKTEADRLSVQSRNFTYVLYSVAFITLLVATCYVLPELNKVLSNTKSGINFGQAFSMTMLRALTLAPLVYMIYFANRRVAILETLRMDYAEKAAASLAYSGYRDQMNADDDLLRQLKASLLSKFQDHPERLLRLGSMSTVAKVTTAGFSAETRVDAKPPATPAQSASGED
jgi:hypothetical protein